LAFYFILQLANGILFDLKTILQEERGHGTPSALASKVGKTIGMLIISKKYSMFI